MGGRDDEPGSYADEEISSSTLEDVPLLIDAVGVIMWLRSVGEPRADTFSKRYSFPPNIQLSFSSSKPHFVAYMEEDQGGVLNFMYYPKVHISERLRFPLPPLVHQFFYFTRLHPIHTLVNIIRVLLGACILNHKYEMHLGLEEVLYAYFIKRHNLIKYYFIANSKLLQLVIYLPETSKNKRQGNVLLFSAYGCARNFLLHELRINVDPDSGLV